jgi:hypothetical protein
LASLDQDMRVDDEERSLFFEMAGDLAYALNYIQMKSDRERSEQKYEELEQQLLQIQKMEAVSRLAGGVVKGLP